MKTAEIRRAAGCLSLRRLMVMAPLGVIAFFCCFSQTHANGATAAELEVSVEVPKELLKDPAVRTGLQALASALRVRGGKLLSESSQLQGYRLELRLAEEPHLGSPEAAVFRSNGEEGYLCSATPLGLAYGLCFLSDLMAATGRFPEQHARFGPKLEYRVLDLGVLVEGGIEGPPTDSASLQTFRQGWTKRIRLALRNGYNIVRIHRTEDYVPWNNKTYGPRADRFRRYLRVACEVAHRYHLKVLLAGDELVYLPGGLTGVPDSAADPNGWKLRVLRAKLERLLRACPEIDGLSTRTGEFIPRYDFRAVDMVGKETPGLAERYRTFLRTVWDVVVGKYGKLYLHRTWVTNDFEQHSVPAVYRWIFESLPTEKFLVAIKVTKTDQWYYYVPFNPTFGQTKHTTLAQCEMYSGALGAGLVLDFPLYYLANGLRWAVERGAKGVMHSNGGRHNAAQDAIFFVMSRLSWTPLADVDSLLGLWIASRYGDKSVPALRQVFRLAPKAIRDGLYVRCWALPEWNPLPHFRTNRMVLAGRPVLDHGLGHHRFLQKLYLQAKAWEGDVLPDLTRGIETADSIVTLLETLQEPRVRSEFLPLARHETSWLRLNREYVRLILRYFEWLDRPSSNARLALEKARTSTQQALTSYQEAFRLFDAKAVEVLLDLARRAIHDRANFLKWLREAPPDSAIGRRLVSAAAEYRRILARSSIRRPLYEWKGTVDGSEVLHFCGDQVKIEHLAWDYPSQTLFRKLGQQASTDEMVVVERLAGRGYLLILPSSAPHCIDVYLEDPQPGSDVYWFRVVAVPKDDGR